jgi:hypothetical protein
MLVLEPTTTAMTCDAKLIGVPETVIAVRPGFSVWPAMIYSEAESSVTVVPASVSDGGSVPSDWAPSWSPRFGMTAMGIVLDPTTTAVTCDARLMGVPNTVMAGPPGFSVWSAITYSEAEFKMAVVTASVNRAGGFPAIWAPSYCA